MGALAGFKFTGGCKFYITQGVNFAFLRGGNFGRGLGRFFFLQKGNFRRDLSVSPNIGDKIQVRNFVKSHRKQKAR